MKTKLLKKLRQRFAWKYKNNKWYIFDVETNLTHSCNYTPIIHKIYQLEDTSMALGEMFYIQGRYLKYVSRIDRIQKRRKKMSQNSKYNILKNLLNK